MANGSQVGAETDIEATINQEVEGMKSATKESLLEAVRIEIACGKLTAPLARRSPL